MDIDYILLVGRWFLVSIDFWMIYFIACSLFGLKALDALRKISVKVVGLASVFGISMGTVFHFLPRPVFQAAVIVATIFLLKAIGRELRLNIGFLESAFIYFVFYSLGHVIIVPFFLFFGSLDLPMLVFHFAAYTGAFVTLFFLCLFIDAAYFFKFIMERFILKSILLILFVVFVTAFAILNFDPEEIIEHILLLVVLAVVTGNCLYYVFKFAHEYMNRMPDKFHDTKKILQILNDQIDEVNDIEAVKAAYRSAAELMGAGTVTEVGFDLDVENSFKTLMLKTISSIQKENSSHIKIEHDIEYESDHPKVTDTITAYLLGTLLENAIQTMTHKPIYIDILFSSYTVIIKVSNESKHREQKYLDEMFKRGRSSKAKVGRGFGLAKLKQVVKKYNGKVSVSQVYKSKENANYLSVLIQF